MPAQATSTSPEQVLWLRTRQRAEMHCQIVHDSIHRREGWTHVYMLEWARVVVGFGSIAIAGPWMGKPTVFEFYVLPAYRAHAFDLFEAFLAASRARFFEVQSNDTLLSVMLHAYGRDIVSEKIVFADHVTTAFASPGAVLRCLTQTTEIRSAIGRQQGGGEWVLEIDGAKAASGGILFHYNRPYGDIYMEVMEPYLRRGLGTYLVQELKRICYEFGAIPCARCNTTNIPSRRTLLKAGFAPFAHILIASIGDVEAKP